MRAILVILMSFALVGCGDNDARHPTEAADRSLHSGVIAAMCVPWSEMREDALADLIEAATDTDLDEPITFDHIRDMAGDVRPDDCIEAGYGDPGPKPSDPRRENVRDRMRDIPPPPPPDRPLTDLRVGR